MGYIDYDERLNQCPLNSHNHCKKRPTNLKGPGRVVRLCILGIFLPTAFIALPLYMRYHVYGSQLYPLAMSDMRLLDNKVSTTWCQRQSVRVNTTFNAFLLPEAPRLSKTLKELSMVRSLSLEDDTKEYWGFYLLQGSSVTVSTCVRWPGASLIIIKGHRHLHECAYIGDDSSEELKEMVESIREGDYKRNDNTFMNDDESKTNEPNLMKRHRIDVKFHHPSHRSDNYTIGQNIEHSDIKDAKLMKKLLDALQEKSKQQRKRINDYMVVPRNSTIASDEMKNINIESPHITQSHSQEIYSQIVEKLQSAGKSKTKILDKLNKMFSTNEKHTINMKGRHYHKPAINFSENIDSSNRRKRDLQLLMSVDDNENDLGVEEGFTPIPDGIADHRGTFNETTLDDHSNSEFWSSFSSSEESLLKCPGLILNLPLTPHHKCNVNLTDVEAEETYLANTITYKVPANGYYFFVFNSENEVQTNYIRVKFHLEKSVYNVSNSIQSCTNSSHTCAVNLKFFSSEKLVMELPLKDNISLWNEEFIVISECEPRTAVYVVCVLAVPILVIIFAFS